jgi:RNA polymerase sporulation-specific sigma factor
LAENCILSIPVKDGRRLLIGGIKMYEELNELLAKAKLGDKKSKQKILELLYPLIISSIRRYYNKSNEYEDLIQGGREVILYCINNFDETKGVHFLGYIKTRLRYFYLNKHNEKLTISLNAKVGEDNEEEIVDLLKSDIENPLESLLRLEEKMILQDALSTLTTRQGEIIIDFYFENLTLDEISKKLDISYRTVVNTKTAALNKLRKQLRGKK